MKTKIISWLSCMAVLAFLLQSCRHDELTNPENSLPNSSSLAAKYASKSPWKEDEVYISKVQQVFLKHANLPRVNETYGELHWEYAMSFGQFGERYALVPVVKNNKVSLIMEAVRKENKVYFYEKKDADLLQFFNYLLYSPTSDYTETINGADTTGKAKYVCTTRTFIVGCGNGPTDCVPIISSQMVCEWKEDLGSGIPPQTFDPCGDPFGGGCGGGGSDGGFEYPEPPQETPCEKLKAQNTDVNFKAKVSELDKDEMFNNYQETGFASAYGTVPYEQMLNTANGNVKLPTGNKYFGFMHVHLNLEGVVKIFSPNDIATFLTSCVRSAEQNGNISDAYAMVITSQGNYILQYSGDGTYNIGPNQINNWYDWYEKEYNKLTENELSNPAIVEKLFTQLLEEKVNVDGLEVYKSDKSTGNASRLKYNGLNNPVQSVPCPN